MGRSVSTYLTTKEAEQFEAFCKNHNCTKYAAYRAALIRLLKSKAKTLNIPQKA